MKKIIALTFFIINLSVFSQVIESPWVKAPLPGMKMTGGYMIIKNDTAKDLTLKKVTGEDCEAYEIHTHNKVNGVMKMRQVKELVIKAHDSVTLKPKSFHIMMIQLTKKLSVGSHTKMTLHFSNGREIQVSAPVRQMK